MKRGLVLVVLLVLLVPFVSAGFLGDVWDGLTDLFGGDEVAPEREIIDVGSVEVPRGENEWEWRKVMYLHKATNAHGELYGQGNYEFPVNLPVGAKVDYPDLRKCSPNNEHRILCLYSLEEGGVTNAHAFTSCQEDYQNVCHRAVTRCSIGDGACPSGKDAIVWLNAENNAHLSLTKQGKFDKAVCCVVEKEVPVSRPDVSTREDIRESLGDSCNVDSDCPSNYCDPVLNVCSVRDPGDNCVDDIECPGSCERNVCLPGEGGDSCNVDDDCDADLVCRNNICVGDSAEGDSCNVHDDCESGLCIEGVCSSFPDNPGDPCGELVGCFGDLECVDGVCVEEEPPEFITAGLGEACNVDITCTGGYVCSSEGVCAECGEDNPCVGEDVTCYDDGKCGLTESGEEPDPIGSENRHRSDKRTCSSIGGHYCGTSDCLDGEPIDKGEWEDDKRSGNCCQETVNMEGEFVACKDSFYNSALGTMQDRYTGPCIDPDGDGFGMMMVVMGGVSSEEPCTTIPGNQLTGDVPFYSLMSLLLGWVILVVFYGFRLNRKV